MVAAQLKPPLTYFRRHQRVLGIRVGKGFVLHIVQPVEHVEILVCVLCADDVHLHPAVFAVAGVAYAEGKFHAFLVEIVPVPVDGGEFEERFAVVGIDEIQRITRVVGGVPSGCSALWGPLKIGREGGF